jgi:pimeloyl-CoA dehydrogenase small subunit
MDFDLSEEQNLLRQSAERLLADQYDFEARKQHGQDEPGWSRAMWAKFAELGLLAIPFSEEDGGLGGGPVELMLVAEAMGAKLTLEPYLPTVILGGGILRRAPESLRQRWLEGVIAGTTLLSLAHAERQARFTLSDVATRVRLDGDHYVLDGDKSLILAGDSADALVVTARLSGERRDEGGIVLLLVDAKAEGVTRNGYATQDGRRAAEIQFRNVRVSQDNLIAGPETGFALLQAVTDEAIAALCAEAVGAMSAISGLTVEYLKTRKQFGVPIGSFQALQHRASDMYVELEQARSMALFATMMAAEQDAAKRGRAISAAKVQIGRSARQIGQEAIQLHGGIGMTMEAAVGHYFKRLTMIELMFGDTDHHLRRVAETVGPL